MMTPKRVEQKTRWPELNKYDSEEEVRQGVVVKTREQ